MIGQGMDHDGRVLARLDDLVEVTDRALAHGARQRAIDPLRFAAAQQESPDEIGGREVVVARDGDERPLEVIGHRLDEARLPAARRSLEHDRQALPEGRLEDLLLVSDRHVVRPRGASRTRAAVQLLRVLTFSCRRTSAERSAERNSGPMTRFRCSGLGIAAWAALPNTRRSSSTSVLAPMLRQRQAVPRRRASPSACRASAAPYRVRSRGRTPIRRTARRATGATPRPAAPTRPRHAGSPLPVPSRRQARGRGDAASRARRGRRRNASRATGAPRIAPASGRRRARRDRRDREEQP